MPERKFNLSRLFLITIFAVLLFISIIFVIYYSAFTQKAILNKATVTKPNLPILNGTMSNLNSPIVTGANKYVDSGDDYIVRFALYRHLQNYNEDFSSEYSKSDDPSIKKFGEWLVLNHKGFFVDLIPAAKDNCNKAFSINDFSPDFKQIIEKNNINKETCGNILTPNTEALFVDLVSLAKSEFKKIKDTDDMNDTLFKLLNQTYPGSSLYTWLKFSEVRDGLYTDGFEALSPKTSADLKALNKVITGAEGELNTLDRKLYMDKVFYEMSKLSINYDKTGVEKYEQYSIKNDQDSLFEVVLNIEEASMIQGLIIFGLIIS